jgi:hypothetical protein
MEQQFLTGGVLQRLATANRHTPPMGNQKNKAIQVTQANQQAPDKAPGNQPRRRFQSSQKIFKQLITGVCIHLAGTRELAGRALGAPTDPIKKGLAPEPAAPPDGGSSVRGHPALPASHKPMGEHNLTTVLNQLAF